MRNRAITILIALALVAVLLLHVVQIQAEEGEKKEKKEVCVVREIRLIGFILQVVDKSNVTIRYREDRDLLMRYSATCILTDTGQERLPFKKEYVWYFWCNITIVDREINITTYMPWPSNVNYTEVKLVRLGGVYDVDITIGNLTVDMESEGNYYVAKVPTKNITSPSILTIITLKGTTTILAIDKLEREVYKVDEGTYYIVDRIEVVNLGNSFSPPTYITLVLPTYPKNVEVQDTVMKYRVNYTVAGYRVKGNTIRINPLTIPTPGSRTVLEVRYVLSNITLPRLINNTYRFSVRTYILKIGSKTITFNNVLDRAVAKVVISTIEVPRIEALEQKTQTAMTLLVATVLVVAIILFVPPLLRKLKHSG